MAMEIELIHQIEKYEFLYNFNLPEYNRKDMAEEAWATIAANTNMSISDCKEKWRNIRSSFLRSMKPSGFKVKKPYYLTEYLKFILPFLKPVCGGIDSSDDTQYDAQSNTITHETEVDVDFIKEEPTEGENEENNENHSDNGILSDLLSQKSTAVRKRRRFVPTKKNHADSLRNRSKGATSTIQRNFSSQPDATGGNYNALRMFLMSLLPELETMTDDQVRIFKIKAMMLIDEIKVNYAQIRKDTNSNNNDRLQKRLINLLLKNLEQRTDESRT